MIGNLLGHTQVVTTARYAHLAADPAEQVSSEIALELGLRPWQEPVEPEFESRFLRQSDLRGNSLRQFEREKSALLQRQLPNGLSTAPAA